MRCCLNYARPSCSSTAYNRGLLLAAPPDLVWTQPKDHTYAVRTFHIIFDCRRARCILVAPASSVRRPTRPFYRNSLYYGSLSKFDANSYRWRERRAMARNHTPDYSHANLTMRLLELMETNGDKKSLRSRDMQAVFVTAAGQLSPPLFIFIQRPRMKRGTPNQHNLIKLAR